MFDVYPSIFGSLIPSYGKNTFFIRTFSLKPVKTSYQELRDSFVCPEAQQLTWFPNLDSHLLSIFLCALIPKPHACTHIHTYAVLYCRCTSNKQFDDFFSHWMNVPEMFTKVLKDYSSSWLLLPSIFFYLSHHLSLIFPNMHFARTHMSCCLNSVWLKIGFIAEDCSERYRIMSSFIWI